MKKINYILCSVSAFVLMSCSITKLSPADINLLEKKINSGNFTVVVSCAHPLRMRNVFLNSSYDLRIKNDSAFAYLPYFGVARTARLGTQDGGIKFEQKMNQQQVVYNSNKKCWDFHFNVTDNQIYYSVDMRIFENGSTLLTVNSSDRDVISFDGQVEP